MQPTNVGIWPRLLVGTQTLATSPAHSWVALTFLGSPGLWPRFTRGTNTTGMATTHHAIQANIGFIGLGDQGAPMARAIADAGWPMHVWARHPHSLAVLASTPHTTHQTVADLGRACDVVGLCLTDDSDVREILEDSGLLTSMPPHGIIVNHGTGDPQTAAALAQRALEQGHEMLDAPISGGSAAAERHTLTTFVGGDTEATQRCRPVFEAFSSTVAYMGPSGTGQLAKLLNNASLLANLRNVEDIIEIGASVGINPRNLLDALKAGSGSSFALQFLAGEISPEMARHLPELWHKDIGHFSDAVRRRGLAPSILEARAHESIEAFYSALVAIGTTTHPPTT
jgi:3-hydroxyisobutyrate dehydrogenase-like beta-hydroxyacid dehydrogenase